MAHCPTLMEFWAFGACKVPSICVLMYLTRFQPFILVIMAKKGNGSSCQNAYNNSTSVQVHSLISHLVEHNQTNENSKGFKRKILFLSLYHLNVILTSMHTPMWL